MNCWKVLVTMQQTEEATIGSGNLLPKADLISSSVF